MTAESFVTGVIGVFLGVGLVYTIHLAVVAKRSHSRWKQLVREREQAERDFKKNLKVLR